MSAHWYYLEDTDESNKQGPVSLEFLLEHVSSDCLISNDEMLQSDTPWMLFSELNDSYKANNSLITTNKTHHQHNKQIAIKITNTGNNHQDASPQIDIKTPNDDTIPNNTSSNQQILNKTKQTQIEQEQYKKQQEKLQKQVLNLKSDESFDEEWFILSSDKGETLGPFTRWQLLKKFNENSINEDSITFLNGSKEFRFLKCCGELRGLLPCIDRDATIESGETDDKHILTKDELENKEYLYKDAYQRECGPISLSEIFYKLEDGILGRNSEIKQDNELCWKTVEFIQKKFSKEWNQMIATREIETETINDNDNDNDDTVYDDISDIESDIESEEMHMGHILDPSFRALIDLDKKTQMDKKIAQKYPQRMKQDDEGDKDEKKKKKKRKRKRKEENKKTKQNKCIYVTGLPLDISMYEMEDFFKKAGVIARDIYQKGKKMITLYEKDGIMKGDALITYHQMASVQLAVDLLDETEIRNGFPVHITIATFKKNKKGNNGCGCGPAPPRKKRRLNEENEATLKQLYGVESELTWDEDIEESVPKLQWIVLKNMWNSKQMENWTSRDVFFDGLKQEVLTECSTIGVVDKYEMYEDNPNGIIRLKFKSAKDAAQCIKQMNRRYFDGNIVDCFYWDGITDYNFIESVKEQKQRFERLHDTLQSASHK